MSKPKILLTNDDGIQAPGLRHLWTALSTIADVTVVAPATNQSGMGMSITHDAPLRFEKADWADNAYSISGTPADCVKMALSVLLDDKPDFVFSGINRGHNAGRNIFYSGTVCAAIEGIYQEIPSVAFSCSELQDPSYALAAEHAPKVLELLLSQPLPDHTLLNINFPDRKDGGFQGIRLARQGRSFIREKPQERVHPVMGHSYYWLGWEERHAEEHQQSDIALLKQGYAVAVPIDLSELTHRGFFDSHGEAFESLFNT